MSPNLYRKNGCFTKHPFQTGCLGFQFPKNEMHISRSCGCLKFLDDQLSKERLGHSGLLRRVPQACPPGSSSWSNQGGGGKLGVFAETDGPILAINGVITPITLLITGRAPLWTSQSNFQLSLWFTGASLSEAGCAEGSAQVPPPCFFFEASISEAYFMDQLDCFPSFASKTGSWKPKLWRRCFSCIAFPRTDEVEMPQWLLINCVSIIISSHFRLYLFLWTWCERLLWRFHRQGALFFFSPWQISRNVEMFRIFTGEPWLFAVEDYTNYIYI